MKNKFVIFGIIAACIFIGIVIYFSILSPIDPPIHDRDSVAGQVEEAIEKPEQIDIIIDNSKSISGYFAPDDITPITSVIAELSSLGKNYSLSFYGQKPQSGKMTAELLKKMDSQKLAKDTNMDSLISGCIDSVSKSNAVAFFTDGIISTAQGKNNLPQIEKIIENKLRAASDTLGWMIIKGESRYEGTYWIESKRPQKYDSTYLTADNRPFYILIFAHKKYIRYIRNEISKWKDMPELNDFIAFNTHDDHTRINFYAPDNNNFKPVPDNPSCINLHSTDFTDNRVVLSFKVPECLVNRVSELSPGNSELKIGNYRLNKWKIEKTKNPQEFKLYIDSEEFERMYPNEPSLLELSFSTSPSKNIDDWKNKYSTDADDSIKYNVDIQKRTYSLNSSLQPMLKASKNDEVKISITIDKM